MPGDNTGDNVLPFPNPPRTDYSLGVQQGNTMRRAGWFVTLLLFGVPAMIFASLFHWLGPNLIDSGTSWWGTFHWLVIMPLACMLSAAVIGAAADVGPISAKRLIQRLRLAIPRPTAWLWAGALSGFMYGGNLGDSIAAVASWIALWKENTRKLWVFAAMLIAILVKRNAALLQPTLESIRFFTPSAFHREFFNHFGPRDFMGIPLHEAWWILFYYALVMLVFNIGGEELWWRGYVLPRQELAFGRTAWIVHGMCWSAFHLFMQPTLWDTTRMAVTGLALSFVAQRTRSTWPGIVGHSFGNLPFFLALVRGVTSG